MRTVVSAEKSDLHILYDLLTDQASVFSVKERSLYERILRTYGSVCVRHLPLWVKRCITDGVKRMRNSSRVLSLQYPLSFARIQRVGEVLASRDLLPWAGKRSVICISHDVDDHIGYEYVPHMAELDSAHSVSSTFNFLTKEYAVDVAVLKTLADLGHEVGVHGERHDQGLAYRSPNEITNTVERAHVALGVRGDFGFRSPALSMSAPLLRSLASGGYAYDSSMQIASPFYESVMYPYPYYLQEYGLWELPLMVQDDNYFRDACPSEEEIFISIKRFFDETVTVCGVCVINMHPHLMCERKGFYQKFLGCIDDYRDRCHVWPTGKVISYVKDHLSDC